MYISPNCSNRKKLQYYRFWSNFEGFMASRVQKIKLWDTFKNAKSVILHFFPVAEIGRNIHLLYFSYPQQIYSQFVEGGKKVLSPYSPQWSVYFPVLFLLITRKHPVFTFYMFPNSDCLHNTQRFTVYSPHNHAPSQNSLVSGSDRRRKCEIVTSRGMSRVCRCMNVEHQGSNIFV